MRAVRACVRVWKERCHHYTDDAGTKPTGTPASCLRVLINTVEPLLSPPANAHNNYLLSIISRPAPLLRPHFIRSVPAADAACLATAASPRFIIISRRPPRWHCRPARNNNLGELYGLI